MNKTRDFPTLDMTNMEHSFPLQTIDAIKAFEKNLIEYVEKYKFVSSIMLFFYSLYYILQII